MIFSQINLSRRGCVTSMSLKKKLLSLDSLCLLCPKGRFWGWTCSATEDMVTASRDNFTSIIQKLHGSQSDFVDCKFTGVACSNSFPAQKVLHYPAARFPAPCPPLCLLYSPFHTRLLTQLSSFQLALPSVPSASNSLYLLWFFLQISPGLPPSHSDLCLTVTPQQGASHPILHLGCFAFHYSIFLFLTFYL